MKNLKNKIISFVLIFTVLTSFGATLPLAYAQNTQNITYYISEDFSSYTTNALADSVTFTSGSGIVCENEEKNNKYLEASAKSGTIVFTQNFKYDAPDKDFKFSIDAGFDGNLKSASINLVSANGKFVVAKIDAQKSVRAYDGKRVGTLASKKLTTILIDFNKEHSRYSMYINDKCVLKDYYIGVSCPNTYNGFEVNAEINGETKIFVDNAYAYTSDKIIKAKDLPVTSYNESAVEIKEYEDILYNDTRVIKMDNYEPDPRAYHEKFKAWSFLTYPYDNIMEERVDEDGNGYLYIETRSGNKNSFIVFDMEDKQRGTVEFDIRNITNSVLGFTLYDSNNNSVSVLECDTNLRLSSNGTTVGNLITNRKSRIAISVDNVAKTVNIYVDGVHTGVDIPLKNEALENLSRIRFYPKNTHAENKITLDNCISYTSSELYDYSKILAGELDLNSTIYDHNTRGVNEFLQKYNAIHTVTGKLHVGSMGKVTKMPYWENGVLYVALADAEALVYGEAKSKSDEFVALNSFVENAGKKATYNATNTVLVGDKEAVISDTMIKQVNAFMTYDRPSADELLEKFTPARPRVILSADRLAELKAAYGKDKYITKWGNDFIKKADHYLTVPPQEYVSPDGDAGRLLVPSGNIRDRIERLAFAYFFTGDKKYVDRAWVEIENACLVFPNWHQGINGLDVSGMVQAISIGYDWLYDQWDEEQRKVMEFAVFDRVLDMAQESYHNMRPYGQYIQINNWNPACNAGTTLASIAFFESNPQMCADIISNAVKCLDYAILDFYPDGAWKEGPGYWAGTVQGEAIMCSSLTNVFGTSFNIENTACFDITCDYIIGNAGPTGNNNYNDAKETSQGSAPVFMWFANTFNKPEYTIARVNEIENGLTTLDTIDMLYYDINTNFDKSATRLDYYFKDLELVSFLSAQGDPNATYVSFHSGNNLNADAHSHIDSGTFVIDMMGERFARDAGSHYYFVEGHGQYPNIQPNNDKITRWNYYNHIPEGHNTLVINPDDKTMGQNIITDDKIETVVTKPRGAYAVTSLASAYKGFAKDVRRGIMLGDDRRSVTVRDEIKLNDGENDIYWFMQTGVENKIEYVDDKTVIMNQNGKKVKMTLLTDATSFEMYEEKCIQMYLTPAPEQQQIENLKRFAIHLKASGSAYIQVKFIPLDDPAANNPQENINLDNWSIPDGELQELPYISSLKVDGNVTESFKPDAPASVIPVDVTTKVVPTLTWDIKGEFDASITKYAQNIDDSVTIRVWRKDDPSLYRIYTITFNPYEISGLEPYRITPVAAEASHVPQVENGPANIYDNNLSSYWGADGKDRWIIADLGEVKLIDFIGVALSKGDARVTTYKLYISEDKENWEMVFDGESSGTTTNIELSKKVGKNARYIKFVGYGNTVNEWNSVTEICAYSLGF